MAALLDNNTFISKSIEHLVKNCNTVFLCVKPDAMEELLNQINLYIKPTDDILFITIAAGKNLEFYENILKNARVIRTMPNMPAAIGYGMSSLVKGKNATNSDMQYAVSLMNMIGRSLVLEKESDINITTAIAGSGPAFAFMFLEALESVAIDNNISKQDARLMACQMLKGSAAYAMEQEQDMYKLVQSICSPNGTTIEGVNVLKNNDFENIIKKAILAAKKRSEQISGDNIACSDVIIYTDGACKYNPGPGGYAAVLMYNGIQKEITGYKKETTNNEMELTAALQALLYLEKPCNVTLHSDSSYLINGFNEGWVNSWKSNGWKRGKNEEVKNLQIWKDLDQLNQKHKIKWVKVKGHSDDVYNNKCDELANQAIINKGA